jgi:general stress protein YciG
VFNITRKEIEDYMAGTLIGGKKAAAANLARDPDFYKKIGKIGGSAPNETPKGFAAMTPEKRSAAGKVGGKISRRTGVKNVKKTTE